MSKRELLRDAVLLCCPEATSRSSMMIASFLSSADSCRTCCANLQIFVLSSRVEGGFVLVASTDGMANASRAGCSQHLVSVSKSTITVSDD